MCVVCVSDGQKRDHDQDEQEEDYQVGRKRQRGEGGRVDLRVLLQSKVCIIQISRPPPVVRPVQTGTY